MSSGRGLVRHLIWATRGRDWGFRFLLDGGLEDPLPTYKAAFFDFEDERNFFIRLEDLSILRFEDPEARRDRASRIIPHEFITKGGFPPDVKTLEQAVDTIWPVVSELYGRLWSQPDPPLDSEIQAYFAQAER